MRAARNPENRVGPKQGEEVPQCGSPPVWKFTLPALLIVLLILMACSGTTSTPEGTAVAVPTAVPERAGGSPLSQGADKQ